MAVSFEANSWGKPLTTWVISHDGTGTWTKAEPFSGKSTPAVGETHSVTVPAGGLVRLDAILSKLPDTPPSDDNCKNRVTDMPYGKLAFSGGGQGGEKVYAFNLGCLDPAYRAFLDRLREADELVATWGRAGPLVSKGPIAQPVS